MKQKEKVEDLILKYQIFTPTGSYQLQVTTDNDRLIAYKLLGGN